MNKGTLRTTLGVVLLAMSAMPLWGEDSKQPSADGLESADALEGGNDLLGDLDSLEGGEEEPAAIARAVTQADDGIECAGKGKGVCIEKATGLPLRVLPRPFSALHATPDAGDDSITQANLPAFHPWYVFERKDLDLSDPAEARGWYRVGRDRDKASGWLRARDAFEWRQALLVSYTHPGDPGEGRHPVLLFSDPARPVDLVEAGDGGETAMALYQQIDQGKIPKDVVSMEPKRFVDISKTFYLLPILRFKIFEVEGEQLRLLQIAAAVPKARGTDTLANEDYAGQARAGRDSGSRQRIEKIRVDVVFVIDTTRSMQPYIDLTRDAMRGLIDRLRGKLNERVRFGLIGYRDSLKAVPKLEYVTRNFTPKLVDAKTLVERLDKDARATSVGSHDYQEEGFAGIQTALASAWREDALRFIVWIGDASSHPKGHPQNTTGMGAEELLRRAEDQQVHVIALHLRDPRAAKDFPLGEAQMRTLSRVRGSEGDSAYLAVDAFHKQDFAKAVDTFAGMIEHNISAALAEAGKDAKGGLLQAAKAGEKQGDKVEEAATQAFGKAWKAALIEYLGQDARPPKDIVAWVLDRDLVDPTMRALDVRLLITRTQLSSLVQALDRVIEALMKSEASQAQFFQALQAVAGQAMKQPEHLGEAQRLVDTGLLPAFIQSLPYKSDILTLTEERYASMTADQRAQLQWSLLAKLQQYRDINEQVDQWQRLNETDSDAEMVYPLNIDYLP